MGWVQMTVLTAYTAKFDSESKKKCMWRMRKRASYDMEHIEARKCKCGLPIKRIKHHRLLRKVFARKA